MLGFLSANWIWIVLIVGMLAMHLTHGHGGHGGGGHGRGGHGSGGHGHGSHGGGHAGQDPHGERLDDRDPLVKRPVEHTAHDGEAGTPASTDRGHRHRGGC